MRLLKQSSSAQALMFLMVDSTDHISGKTGLTPTVTFSKNGSTFTAKDAATTVSEVGNGYYKCTGTGLATDTNTLGPLILHATASGADPTDVEYAVVAFDPQSSTDLGLSRIDATIGSRQATVTFPSNFGIMAIDGTGRVTAGTVADKTGYSLANNSVNANSVSDAAAQEIANAVWTANITNDYSVGGNPSAAWANDTMGKRVLRSSSNTDATEAVVADAVWEEPRNDHDTGNTMGHSLDQIRKATYATVGTIDGTSTASVLNTNLTGYANNAFDQQSLVFLNGSLAGESSVILTYNTDGTITMDQPFTSAPTNAIPDEFVILPTHVYPLSVLEDSIADAILGRNIAGGSDGGRMVKDALRILRNRFAVSSGTLTVYQEDDTTAAWTATVTGDAAADPIVESNPA